MVKPVRPGGGGRGTGAIGGRGPAPRGRSVLSRVTNIVHGQSTNGGGTRGRAGSGTRGRGGHHEGAPRSPFLGPITRCLPVSGVSGNVVCAGSRHCVGVVRIVPVGFLLEDTERRQDVVCSFVDCLGVDPMGVRFGILAGHTSLGGRASVIHERVSIRRSPGYHVLRRSCLRLVGQVNSHRTAAEQFFVTFRCRRINQHNNGRRTSTVTSLRVTTHATTGCLGRYKGRILVPRGRSRFAISILCGVLYERADSSVPLPREMRGVISGCVTTNGSAGTVPYARFFTPRGVSFARNGCVCVSKRCRSCLLVPSFKCGSHMTTN